MSIFGDNCWTIDMLHCTKCGVYYADKCDCKPFPTQNMDVRQFQKLKNTYRDNTDHKTQKEIYDSLFIQQVDMKFNPLLNGTTLEINNEWVVKQKRTQYKQGVKYDT